MGSRILLSVSLLGMVVGWGGMCSGQVTGKATLAGTPPAPRPVSTTPDCEAAHPGKTPKDESVIVGKGGELKNVIVSIKDAPESPAAGKLPDAVIDQKGCSYTPHVTAFRTGQKVIVKNSDPLLHNVHGFPEENVAFNFAQIANDPGRPLPTVKVAEVFRIKCDIHPWMAAWVAVFELPYFAVTGDDGRFEIKGLPDGEYNAQAWHERFGAVDGKVTVKDGKGAVDFNFIAERK